jgi:hypothetical protein
MDAAQIVNDLELMAVKNGWDKTSYTTAQRVINRVGDNIHVYVAKNKLTYKGLRAKLHEACPYTGTYTFTDGVVDYALGLCLMAIRSGLDNHYN